VKAGDVVGPYQLMGTLGRGGMGVVYRARDVRTGTAAAVKTVPSPDERLVHGLRREIAALSRLHHPGVVRLLDQGEFEALPWYAMELLEGPTLREAAASVHTALPTAALPTLLDALTRPADPGAAARTDRIDEELDAEPTAEVPVVRPVAGGSLLDVLALVHGVCAPLAYLHGEGLIHRDLKPDNVVCLADGRLVLVDFGLLSHFASVDGREALALETRSHGTLSYLAPEVIRGEAVDARADLYALGVILYELVTGLVPFRNLSPGAVLYQHLGSAPVPPSQRADGVPAPLDALILRLLAKEPHERLGYADDVRRALEDLGVPARRAGGPEPRSYLYRPRLVGRLAEVEEARSWLARPTGTFTVAGGAGVGKTRLLVEIAGEAARRGLPVLTVDPDPPGVDAGRPPLRSIATALADRWRLSDAAGLGDAIGPDADLLHALLPELGGLLPQPRASPLPPDARRRRATAALANALAAWGDGRTTLLVCDDLPWAGDALAALVAHVREQQPAGLAIVAAVRERDGAASPGVHLAALDEAGVRQMASDMLGIPSPPGDLVRFLVERSEGVPRYVVELLRALVAERLLVRDARGRWRASAAAIDPARSALAAVRSPETLVALARARVGELGREARSIASVLATFGRGAARSDVLAVALARGMGAARFGAALDEATARGVVQQSAGDLRFAHQDLAAAVRAELVEDERVALHSAVADHGLTSRWADAPASALALAWQMEQAGRVAEAAEVAERAAERALSAAALDVAERLIRLRNRCADRDIVRWRSRLAAEVLAPRGRTSEALEELASARQAPRRTVGETLALAEAVAEITAQIGRLDDAQAALAEALALLAREPDAAVEARLRGRLGALLRSAGLAAAAEAELRRSVRLARAAGSRAVWARAWTGLAALALSRGRNREARTLTHRALRALRDADDPGAVCDALVVLGVASARAGRVDAGLGQLEEAIRVAGEDAVREGVVRSERADVRLLAGDAPGALAEHGRALALLREAGHHRSQAEALLRAGRAHRLVGDAATSVQLFDRAAVLAVAVGNERLALSARVEAAEATSDPVEAARRAFAVIERARRLADASVHARAVARLLEVAPDRAAPWVEAAKAEAHHSGDRELLLRLDFGAGGDPVDVLDRAIADGFWGVAAAALERLGRVSEAHALRQEQRMSWRIGDALAAP
jgi:serine/threonine protein kinase/tetratricopeptide (TPR) repeat protein